MSKSRFDPQNPPDCKDDTDEWFVTFSTRNEGNFICYENSDRKGEREIPQGRPFPISLDWPPNLRKAVREYLTILDASFIEVQY